MTERTVKLNNGVEMPLLGLGVYLTKDETEMQNAVDWSLEAGYQNFDTAQRYANEDLLGLALERNGSARKDYFITSKINTCNMGYEKALASFEESLQKLRTDYLDLLLIHWPGQDRERCLDTWRAMEELNRQKKARAIGVCNCQARHLEWFLKGSTMTPAVNQIERHPFLTQKPLWEFCDAYHILCEAYAPLIRGNLDLPELLNLAKKYGKTPAQIVLRWDIQSGFAIIPKSVHKERIFENAAIFDFNLEEADMALLDSLNREHRTGGNPETFDY